MNKEKPMEKDADRGGGGDGGSLNTCFLCSARTFGLVQPGEKAKREKGTRKHKLTSSSQSNRAGL